MIRRIKELFTQKDKEEIIDPPGRTFKKVLTGDYFSLEHIEDVKKKQTKEAKEKKIELIKKMGLKPIFIRYDYKNDSCISAKVTFQKEVFAKKWNMLHITDLTFIVRESEFEEFEKMASVSLKNDFKNLTEVQYAGEERRKERRAS